MKIGDKVKLLDDVTWHAFSHWSLTQGNPLYIISINGDSAFIDTVPKPDIGVVKDLIGEGVFLEDIELWRE